MNTTSLPTRKLAAGVAAVVLTFAAAGAAVAVNLGSNSGVDTPAGKLTATEAVSDTTAAPAATPSTIYVDVTVPIAEAPVPESTDPSTPAPSPVSPSATSSAATGSDDRDQVERHDDDHDGSDHEGSDDEGSDDDD